jgi:hypothetical protein
MDGLTADELRALFATEFNKVLGTTPQARFERAHLLNMLTRKLTAHFDAAGWPATQEETLAYVRQAVERYG